MCLTRGSVIWCRATQAHWKGDGQCAEMAVEAAGWKLVLCWSEWSCPFLPAHSHLPARASAITCVATQEAGTEKLLSWKPATVKSMGISQASKNSFLQCEATGMSGQAWWQAQCHPFQSSLDGSWWSSWWAATGWNCSAGQGCLQALHWTRQAQQNLKYVLTCF